MRKTFRHVFGAVAGAVALIAGMAVVPAQAATGTVVILGDSYSSGNGAGNYIADGTNCKRSRDAFGTLIAAANGLTADFQACSGAITDDVLNRQLGALNSSTKYVTVSIGGNDVGFADVMTKCVMPFSNSGCFNGITAARAKAETELPGKLDRVYAAIKERAPQAKVVVAGYPRLIGSCSALNVITRGETTAINDASDRLNEITQAAANRAGFSFADVRPSFVGRAVCDNPEWIHHVVLSDITASFHPKADGQRYGYGMPVANRMGLRTPGTTALPSGGSSVTTGGVTSSDTSRGEIELEDLSVSQIEAIAKDTGVSQQQLDQVLEAREAGASLAGGGATTTGAATTER